jgi:Flp pilus assembly pilin Flp
MDTDDRATLIEIALLALVILCYLIALVQRLRAAEIGL